MGGHKTGCIALGAAAVSAMFKARTSPDPHRPTMAPVTDGPYRFTRNPIYVAIMAAAEAGHGLRLSAAEARWATSSFGRLLFMH